MAHTTRALVGLLWGLLLAFSVAAAGQTEATRDRGDTLPGMKVARASYQKALKHFNQKEYARAQKELEVCLEKMPDSTEAHFLLAKSFYALKAYPEALTEIEAAKATHAVSVARLEAAQEDRRSDLRRRRRVQDQVLSDLRQELGRTTDPNARKFVEGQIGAAETVRFDIEAELNNFPAMAGGIPADYFFFHGNILLRLQRLDEAVSGVPGSAQARARPRRGLQQPGEPLLRREAAPAGTRSHRAGRGPGRQGQPRAEAGGTPGDRALKASSVPGPGVHGTCSFAFPLFPPHPGRQRRIDRRAALP